MQRNYVTANIKILFCHIISKVITFVVRSFFKNIQVRIGLMKIATIANNTNGSSFNHFENCLNTTAWNLFLFSSFRNSWRNFENLQTVAAINAIRIKHIISKITARDSLRMVSRTGTSKFSERLFLT